MKGGIKIAMIGAIAVLLLDTIASYLALWFGPDYGWFSFGSFSLYILFGYLAGRRSRWFVGGIVGGFMSLVESTLGWFISWHIGPGKVTSEITPSVIAVMISFMIAAGGMAGLIGGALSLLKRSDA